MLGKAADWAPYKGKTGDYFKGFVQDAYNEKFYRPMARLAGSVGKTIARKGRAAWRDLIRRIPGRRMAMQYNGLYGHSHNAVTSREYKRYEKGVREVPCEKIAA